LYKIKISPAFLNFNDKKYALARGDRSSLLNLLLGDDFSPHAPRQGLLGSADNQGGFVFGASGGLKVRTLS